MSEITAEWIAVDWGATNLRAFAMVENVIFHPLRG